MYFGIYQALAEDERRVGLFRSFEPDFFDLVIVDECHRGSARDESSWRVVLDYFQPAAQLGMTATPLREETRDTYLYFGDPIYPLQFEEFAACQAWWTQRVENERAWTVPAAELLAGNCNLDRKNPRAKEDIAHLPPEQIAASILEKEQRIAAIMQRTQKLLAEGADS
jgi:Type III restriction enzyme, res subunit